MSTNKEQQLQQQLDEAYMKLSHKHKEPAIKRYEELGGDVEQNPLERLRFFCSLAMDSQDWFDVEPFFDAVQYDIDHLRSIFRVNILRLAPDTSHDEIDRVLNGAEVK